MVKKTLWELNAEMQEFVNKMERYTKLADGKLVDEETGEVFEVNALEDIKGELKQKIIQCLYVHKNLDFEVASIQGQIDYLNKQKDQLAKHKNALLNQRKWLDEQILVALNGEKFKDKEAGISCYSKLNQPSVRITDIDKIPDIYFRKTEASLVKDMVKADGNVPGTEIVRTTSLIVR